MELADLGYNEAVDTGNKETNTEGFEIGRIIAEHKERYIVRTINDELEAEITGNLRFSAESREDFPAVGDWVTLVSYDPSVAIIHKVLPRYSSLKRQAPGQTGETQIIATNIDHAFIVQGADRDFNINRLERYLTICHSSRIDPVIVLTKTDLVAEQRTSEILEQINQRNKHIPVLAISNKTKTGYEGLARLIKKGQTYCLLGSSGVGKSSLLNNLSGKGLMKTAAISENTQKGKHTTSHRELTILENGGILIDNPGMREVGIADAANGLETAFYRITSLSENCRFKDCMHINETGCAVIEAVRNGELDQSCYDNYLKMDKERAHFESTVAERRKKDKQLGKILRNYKKDMRKNENS